VQDPQKGLAVKTKGKKKSTSPRSGLSPGEPREKRRVQNKPEGGYRFEKQLKKSEKGTKMVRSQRRRPGPGLREKPTKERSKTKGQSNFGLTVELLQTLMQTKDHYNHPSRPSRGPEMGGSVKKYKHRETVLLQRRSLVGRNFRKKESVKRGGETHAKSHSKGSLEKEKNQRELEKGIESLGPIGDGSNSGRGRIKIQKKKNQRGTRGGESIKLWPTPPQNDYRPRERNRVGIKKKLKKRGKFEHLTARELENISCE